MTPTLLRLLTAIAAAALVMAACQPRTAARPPAQPADGAAAGGSVASGGSGTFDDRAIARFYEGKTVRFVVGFAPGGGFDTYTRTIARHIGKHIPGNPAVIVDNMVGGGSLTAANYIYGGTRPDGLTIGNWIGGLIMQQVLGGEGIEFDGRKFRFIGAPTPDSIVCAARKESGFKTLSETINAPQPLILGGTAPGSTTDDAPKILAAALGMNLKLVSGYGGTANIRQAADGGEIHGGCWSWESIKVTWKAAIESGDAQVIGQLTAQKLADLPDVELVLDLARTEEAKQLIRSGVLVPSIITRPYSMHPDTPNERVLAMRQAFMATFKDPEFIEEAEKARLDVAPIPGDEVEKLVRELFDAPEPVKAKLKSLLVIS